MGAALVLAMSAGASVARGQVIDWASSSDGDWGNPANWSPMLVPDSPGEIGRIAEPGTYVISVASSPQAGLQLLNAGTTIELENVRTFTLSGTTQIINGVFVVNPSGGISATSLRLSEDVEEVLGTGVIVLNDSSPGSLGRAQFSDAVTGVSTILGPELLVRGSGYVSATVLNRGIIRADVDGFVLNVFGSAKGNEGQLEATDGGILRIASVIDQSPTARILADGGVVRLTNATINGGEIDGALGLVEVAAGNALFDDVELVTGGVEIENVRQLTVNNGLTLDGEILVNRDGGISSTRLLFGTDGMIDGDATITLNDTSPAGAGRAMLADTVIGLTTTLADTVLVHGSGTISAVLVNEGTISADVDGFALNVTPSAHTNNGLMEAVDGGVLRLTTTVNQGSGGVVEAAGGVVRMATATISGGSVVNRGGTFEIAEGIGTFDGVDRATGNFEIQNVRQLIIIDGLTLDGEILVNRDGGISSTRLLFGSSGTIDGDGVISLNDSASTASGRATLGDTTTGLTTTLADTVLVRGSGTVTASLVNEGTIRADVDGGELLLSSSPKTNDGLMESTNNGRLRITTTVNQGPDGRIVSNGGTVRMASATINSGQITNMAGVVEVAAGNATFDSTSIEGEVQIENVRLLTLRNDTELNGVIVVNRDGGISATQLQAATAGTISGTGEIFLNDSATNPGGRAQLNQGVTGIETVLGQGITVSGNGYLRGAFNVQGTLAPGRIGSALGETATLDASGTLNLSSTSTVEIQVGGRAMGEFDRITGNAAINLAGTLDATAIEGFVPDTCENFTIISGSAINGEFHELVSADLGGNQQWRLFYTGNTVELRATCLPDIDGDCSLTIFDFLEFQNLFDSGNLEADFDGDGSLTLFDFLAFQNAFDMGCG
ncbi:MAG: GC-type dockerin domain-anchored protein [Phycisphaerales bacterium JB060]